MTADHTACFLSTFASIIMVFGPRSSSRPASASLLDQCVDLMYDRRLLTNRVFDLKNTDAARQTTHDKSTVIVDC